MANHVRAFERGMLVSITITQQAFAFLWLREVSSPWDSRGEELTDAGSRPAGGKESAEVERETNCLTIVSQMLSWEIEEGQPCSGSSEVIPLTCRRS